MFSKTFPASSNVQNHWFPITLIVLSIVLKSSTAYNKEKGEGEEEGEEEQEEGQEEEEEHTSFSVASTGSVSCPCVSSRSCQPRYIAYTYTYACISYSEDAHIDSFSGWLQSPLLFVLLHTDCIVQISVIFRLTRPCG